MELQIKTSGGAESGGQLTVADAAFGQEYKEGLVHQVVTAYMAGARSGTKAQKTRSEVSGGGKKPWRQKGTGRARSGSIRSPIWRTGGVTFAAKPRSYAQKVNRKMYRGALRSVVSELARTGALIVADFAVDQPKTRAMKEKLQGLGVDDVLLVGVDIPDAVYLAARNLPHVDVMEAGEVNPLALLRHQNVVMTEAAVRQLEEWLQ